MGRSVSPLGFDSKGFDLTAIERIQEKLEKIYALHPQERARIEKVVEIIFEMDRWIVYKTFENTLQKIVDAKTPSETKRMIDGLSLFASPIFGRMAKMDKSAKRYSKVQIKLLVIIAVITLLLGVILHFFKY